MPVATPAQYRAMLDAAQQGGYAYPAINVTSLPTINGALKAFAEAKSDGSFKSPLAVVNLPLAPP
jgi:fructose-bisphosphate aldolase, class II